MLSDKTITKWEQGIITDRGVYEECETDLEFYNFLGCQCFDEEQIQEIMRKVTGADDAFYNALDQAEYNYSCFGLRCPFDNGD